MFCQNLAMSLIVQKYGGSSVADAEGLKRVANRIVATKKAGHQVCVVVSAMGDTTDELIDLANQVSPMPTGRELDMLLTAGERISMALLAMAIGNLGHEAMSFTGSQAGVITDSTHGKARIIDVTPGRIQEALETGHIAIVAGFQGISSDTNDVTTLGRGGSDTTAVALAAALEADVCEIYTDVDGVYSADPRVVPAARKLTTVTYEEMLELAASGAKVLHLRCVEYARRSIFLFTYVHLFLITKAHGLLKTIQKEQAIWNRRLSAELHTIRAKRRSPLLVFLIARELLRESSKLLQMQISTST